MKPTIKSSIPLTFLRFSIGIVIFMFAVEIFTYYLVVYRDIGWYSLSRVRILSDGRVFYEAARYKPGTHSGSISYFDEALQNTKQMPREYIKWIFESDTATLRFYSEKAVERNSHVVNLIHYPYTSDALIWWNGPKGQVDGYSIFYRKRLASLGPVGPAVKAPSRPEERFNISNLYTAYSDTSTFTYLPTSEGIYKLSWENDYIRAKLVYGGPYEAFGMLTTENADDTDTSDRRLLIAKDSTLSIFDGEGSLLRTVNLPETAASICGNYCQITLFDNKRVFIDVRRENWDEKTVMLLEEDGSLIRRMDYNTGEITRAMNGGTDRPAFLFPTIMPPIPWPGIMERSALVQSIALSLILATIVCWRQTRLGHRGTRRAAWTAFVFVSGLLGFLTHLVAYRDRHSEYCLDCRRQRLVDEETCPHCGSSWPAPKPLGIEIIDTA
jgi:hypothetical protein